MKNIEPIAVTSRAFSKNPILREELLSKFENVLFNDSGRVLVGDELITFLEEKVRPL